MNIVSLKVKNFMSISDVELKPGQINQIVGRNTQGKTTILKALQVGAEGSTDGSLVKFGENEAEILIQLDDETTIRRRIKADGKQTVDVRKGEFKIPQPQAYLEQFFDFSAFNPLEVLEPKRRSEAIMKSIEIAVDAPTLAAKIGVEEKDLPPVDFNQHGLKVIEDTRKFYFQRRAEANKDAKEKKARWETYKADFKEPEAPKMQREEIKLRRESCNTVIQQTEGHIARIRGTHEAAKKAQEKLDKYCKAQDEIKANVSKLEAEAGEIDKVLGAEVKRLQEELNAKVAEMGAAANKRMSELTSQIASEKGRIESSQKFIDEAKAEIPEVLEGDDSFVKEQSDARIELGLLDAADKEIDAYEAVAKNKAMIDSMEQEYLAAEAFAEALDKRVVALAGPIKAELMAGAEMPIQGLEYKDDTFLVNGTPVDHLSSSLALKLAVGVARKLSKRTKVICIDGAEMLDETSYSDLLNEIKDDGYTYFITKVGAPVEGVTAITMNQGQVQ